jgi:hypothetical protein
MPDWVGTEVVVIVDEVLVVGRVVGVPGIPTHT